MRDIKFRAWYEVDEKMLNWYEFLDTNMKNTFIAPESTGLILMQYTGLKDVNGKEIYEGDIVLINKEKNIKGIVKYSETYAEFVVVNTNNITDEYEPLADYKKHLEILGNEYENTEILEKEGI